MTEGEVGDEWTVCLWEWCFFGERKGINTKRMCDRESKVVEGCDGFFCREVCFC